LFFWNNRYSINKKRLEKETRNLLIYCLHFAINRFNIISCLFYTRFYLCTANQQAEHRSDNKKKRDFSFSNITDVLNELSKDKDKARELETISQPGNKELPSDSGNRSSSNKARISKPADETEVLN